MRGHVTVELTNLAFLSTAFSLLVIVEILKRWCFGDQFLNDGCVGFCTAVRCWIVIVEMGYSNIDSIGTPTYALAAGFRSEQVSQFDAKRTVNDR